MSVETEDQIRHSPTLRIPLTLGNFATIDTADWHLIAGRRWRTLTGSNGKYAYTGSRSTKEMTMPNMILGCNGIVDHRNGDTLDNRRENLRPCTARQNTMNQRPQRNKLHGVTLKGVCFNIRTQKYRAQIGKAQRPICLGEFSSEAEAGRAYDKAAEEKFGEFAYLNFPNERLS